MTDDHATEAGGLVTMHHGTSMSNFRSIFTYGLQPWAGAVFVTVVPPSTHPSPSGHDPGRKQALSHLNPRALNRPVAQRDQKGTHGTPEDLAEPRRPTRIA